MNIGDIVLNRNITEVLHFTTNQGCLGVLATQSLKARERLTKDNRLEFILQVNAEDRSRDVAWHDYVNLSISRINTNFFNASGYRHKDKDIWWCILSFSPEILEHSGVYFTTTNNMYSGVRRALGADGLEALFAPNIVQWHSNVITRKPELTNYMTTCKQAEVLYPGCVSTRFLRAIYVAEDVHADEVAGQIGAVCHPNIDIIVEPNRFEEFI